MTAEIKEMKQPIEIRELKGGDLFLLLSIIGKLDVKDDIVAIFEQNMDAQKLTADHEKKKPTKTELAKRELETQRRGMKAMATLIQKVIVCLPVVKDDLNLMLASVTDLSKADVEDLGFKEYTDLIMRFFKQEAFKDFLQSITSSI